MTPFFSFKGDALGENIQREHLHGLPALGLILSVPDVASSALPPAPRVMAPRHLAVGWDGHPPSISPVIVPLARGNGEGLEIWGQAGPRSGKAERGWLDPGQEAPPSPPGPSSPGTALPQSEAQPCFYDLQKRVISRC